MIKSVLPIKNIISHIELEDEMKTTKNIIRRNNIILLAAMISLLSGCSSAKTEEVKEEPATTAQVEVNEVEQEAEVETVAEEVVESAVAEVETETTTESIPEPVVYEGIDMESDLSGLEWMETFKGIIDEPKIVVFNDSTNKKVIVENEAEVDFALNDTFAIYAPEDLKIVKKDLITFNIIEHSSMLKFREVFEEYGSGDTATTVNVVEFRGETIELTATLNFE